MLIRSELTMPEDFDPLLARDILQARKHNWQVEIVKASNTEQGQVHPGAALECGDVRFDWLEGRTCWGYRILGQVNAVAALKTGGNIVGFNQANAEVRRCGCTPGTHGPSCAFFELWTTGRLKEVPFRYDVPMQRMRDRLTGTGNPIKRKMQLAGGVHFVLEDRGSHARHLDLNALVGMTDCSGSGDAYRQNDAPLAQLQIPLRTRMAYAAEVVELARPEIIKARIIIP